MPAELGTTNLLLGIMAAASVLEALAIIGMAIAGFVAYGRVMALANEVEARHVAPAMARLHAVLDDVHTVVDDVQAVTSKVKQETERVDDAINAAMDTAGRVRSTIQASAVVGLVRGVRVALEWMLHSRHQKQAGKA